MKYMLDIGAGKYNEELFKPIDNDGLVIVHIDRCYEGDFGESITETAETVRNFISMDQMNLESYMGTGKVPNGKISHLFCKCDVFEFMDNFPLKPFDYINCNRMFEHLEYCGGEVGRMLEACNAISKYNARLEFVVPNAEKLAKMLLQKGDLSDNDVMIINTEFCNGKFDPHASVWTPRLAHKYIEQEATWIISKIEETYPFAGRDIYMKIWCQKPADLQHNKELDKWD